MKNIMILLSLVISYPLLGQVPGKTLKEISNEINRDLPVVYDHITKLITTSVDHNHLSYHFLLDVNEAEFKVALPKVKGQVLGSICSKPRERSILRDHRANIVYRYENTKGQSLGEFMVRPDQCPKG